eukprot:gene25554-1704_t
MTFYTSMTRSALLLTLVCFMTIFSRLQVVRSTDPQTPASVQQHVFCGLGPSSATQVRTQSTKLVFTQLLDPHKTGPKEKRVVNNE